MGSEASRTPPTGLYSEERLAANLAALARRDPELAERLGWPVESEHVSFDPGGALLLTPHREAFSLAEPEAEASAEARAGRVLLLGIGQGEALQRALANELCHEVVAWERDPWLLRLELMRRDHRLHLASGRLRLLLGCDLLGERGFGGAALPHPRLASVYALELESWRAHPLPRRALLCVGKLFYEPVARALRARGFDLWSLDVTRQSIEELVRTVRRFDPELVFAINHTQGLAEFCEAEGRTLVVWEVDPSQYPLPPLDAPTERTHVWTHRYEHVQRYRELGFRQVAHLPLAADPELRRPLDDQGPADTARERAPIAYVGASLALGHDRLRATFETLLRRWSLRTGTPPPELGPLTERLLEAQHQEPSRFLIGELLDRQLPGFLASLRSDPEAPDPALLLGELAGARWRAECVGSLAHLGIDVWGDEGWNELRSEGVRPRGPAGHREELTRIYNATRLNLDIGRVYQPDVVTMRVFDILACGAFVLAENNATLPELFELDREVVGYRGLAELRAKAEHYLEHPAQAASIAARGRERVLAEHTVAHRVQHMLARL